MKRFIEFFIKNAAFTHTLFAIIIIMSFIAYKNVSKELFPPSALDKIVIQGAYPGASPTTLDKMAVSTIEDDLKSYSEVSKIESVIATGSFTITVSLKPNSNKLELLNDFKSIISDAKKDFPSDMNEPTVKILKKAFPLMFISVASDTLDKDELLKRAKEVKKELSVFKDLSKIDIRGESDKNIYIKLDNQKIEALGLNKNLVIDAVSSLSTIFPIGKIKEDYFLSFKNVNVESLKNTIISVGDKKVYLKDIAKVDYEYDTPTQLGKYNGIPNLTIDVRKGESGDAIALSKKIREILKEYHKKHPEVVFGISTDTSKWVRNRFNTVVSNIIFGLILVFFVMWLFLNARISLVVTLGIPTSFAIAMIFLDYLDFSLNLLSMLGALIALGMIVDEAIVVGENIYRHMQMGKDRVTAAIDGATEVFWPVVAAAMTTILAFLPMLLIKGEIGVFIKILPMMISILILSSLFEAFVFLPLHSKEILKVTKEKNYWDRLNLAYKNLLSLFFRWRYVALILFLVGVPFLTAVGMKHLKFQLFPDFDVSQIYVNGKMESNYSLEETSKAIKPIEEDLKKYLGNTVEGFTTVVGMKMNNKGEANTGDNYFHIFVDLKDRKPHDFYNKYIAPLLQPIKVEGVREMSAKELAKRLKEDFKDLKIADEKELNVIVPQAGVVKSDIVIGIGGNNVLKAINELKDKIKTFKGVVNLFDDAELGASELKISVNEYGQKLGITEGYLYKVLRGFFSDADVAKTFGKDGVIKLRLEDKDKDKFEEFKNFRVNVGGNYILLSKIADFKIVKEFKKIHKYNGIEAKTIYASLDKKVITVNEFYKKIDPLLNKLRKEGYTILIGGAKKTSKNFKKDIMESGVVAILLIFLVLVLMFNSVLLPFVIISVIPLSFLGVVIGNFALGLPMTMLGMIGIVGLAGVVVNDGIVMIDFIKKANSMEEILERASFRLRPILLTSLTTFFGLLTLMFFPFGQSAILQPLAVALGFGILWGTVLNLFYVPIFYYVLRRKKLESIY